MPLLPNRSHPRDTDDGSFDLLSPEHPRQARSPIRYGKKRLIPLTAAQFFRTFYGDLREPSPATANLNTSEVRPEDERINSVRQNSVRNRRAESTPERPKSRKSRERLNRRQFPGNELLLIDATRYKPPSDSLDSDEPDIQTEDPIDEKLISPHKQINASDSGNGSTSPTPISKLRKRMKYTSLKQRLIKNIRVRHERCWDPFAERGDGFEKSERTVGYHILSGRRRVPFRPNVRIYKAYPKLEILLGPLPDSRDPAGTNLLLPQKAEAKAEFAEEQAQLQFEVGVVDGIAGPVVQECSVAQPQTKSWGHRLASRCNDTEVRREWILEQLSNISAPAREPESTEDYGESDEDEDG